MQHQRISSAYNVYHEQAEMGQYIIRGREGTFRMMALRRRRQKMTLLSLLVLGLFAIAFAGLAARFAAPPSVLAGAGDFALTVNDMDGAAPATRFGGDRNGEAREPAVAAFPRAM